MKAILAERRWARFWKVHMWNSTARLLDRGGSARGEQSPCGASMRTLYYSFLSKNIGNGRLPCACKNFSCQSDP